MNKEKIGTVLQRLYRLGLGMNGGDVADKRESGRRDVLLTSVISVPPSLTPR